MPDSRHVSIASAVVSRGRSPVRMSSARPRARSASLASIGASSVASSMSGFSVASRASRASSNGRHVAVRRSGSGNGSSEEVDWAGILHLAKKLSPDGTPHPVLIRTIQRDHTNVRRLKQRQALLEALKKKSKDASASVKAAESGRKVAEEAVKDARLRKSAAELSGYQHGEATGMRRAKDAERALDQIGELNREFATVAVARDSACATASALEANVARLREEVALKRVELRGLKAANGHHQSGLVGALANRRTTSPVSSPGGVSGAGAVGPHSPPNLHFPSPVQQPAQQHYMQHQQTPVMMQSLQPIPSASPPGFVAASPSGVAPAAPPGYVMMPVYR